MRSIPAERTDRHVVLIALDGLGDMVLRQPLLTGLADRGDRVSVVVRRGNDEIPRHLDRRLELIVTDIDPHVPPSADTEERLSRLASAVEARQPDLLIAAAHNRTYVDEWLLHRLPECSSIGFFNPLLPASILDDWRIAVPSSSRRSALFTHTVTCAPDAHEIDKYRALFHAITGMDLPDRPPTIALDEDVRQDAVATARGLGLAPGQYAVGCPMGTSTVALKAWPAEQFGELSAHLSQRHGVPVLLIGNEAEASALREIARVGAARGVQMPVWTGGAGSLGTLLGLIALSRLYLGNDTGPMHLAGALGIPVVARFGGGHWPRFLPMARRSFSATQQLPCFDCQWRCWLDDAACMKLIETKTFITGLDWTLSDAADERRIDLGRPLDDQWSSAFIAARDIRRRLEAELTDMTAHATARLAQVRELTGTVEALRKPRMRLAVNVRTLWPGRIGGLEVAFREVMDRLLARHEADLEVTLFTSSANHHAFGDWHGRIQRVLLPDEGWEQVLTERVRRFDVLWCPLFFLEPVVPDAPSVVTIPDLQHEAFPEFFTPETLALRLQRCRTGVAHAAHVLTLSEHSRREIVRTYHVPDEHVTAIHLDSSAEFRRPSDPARTAAVRARYGLPECYGLFPANSWPHKNHRRLFQALARYRERFGDPPAIVLTGATDVSGVDLQQESIAAGVGTLVRHLGYIDRDELPDLYDGAAFLTFVSLYEGFGIPIVEAFRRGTPVIASNTTSLPEIAGDCALLVDPTDPDAIATAIHQTLTNPAATNARVARGRARAERFSYAEAAEATWRVLHDVGGRPVPAPRIVTTTKRPKVLVVTPSFNQGRFLGETIESVLSQDYENLEYVVADGGSTDESVEILRSYGDRVRWTSGPDGGQAAAIARAWMESDADIVAWLNSDDTYLEGSVSTAVDYLLAHPESTMVYGQAWYTNARSERLQPYPTRAFNREALAGDCFICQPATFLRREALKVVAPPDATLRYCMDYDLWIRLSKHFQIDFLDRFLATSRMHAENKTLGEREGVFREIIAVAGRHFGGVDQTWISGYVDYRWNRDAGVARVLPRAVQRRRRAMHADAIRRELDSCLYDDRWAGRRTVVMVDGDAAGRVALECDCPVWPHLDALTITVSCDGEVVAKHDVQDSGTFVLAFQLPARAHARAAVRLEASDAVIPLLRKISEDPRALSFRVLRQVAYGNAAPRTAEHMIPLSA